MPGSEEAKSLDELKISLAALVAEARTSLEKISSSNDLATVKSRFLGRKGDLKKVLAGLGDLPPKDRALLGQVANEVKVALEELMLEREKILKSKSNAEKLKDALDITLPGRSEAFGSTHPLSQVSQLVFSSLERLGFKKAQGPEIELDFYNFEALNIPKSHPARDMQDTFYVDDDVMLRTHTSPVQIRAMLAKKAPPLRIMSYGHVFRRDEDITHSPMFTQVEGLYVDENVSLADLKATLLAFAAEVFSKDAKIRMRPSFFPFTEPSLEVDVSCFSCQGSPDCRLCKGTGFIEILGAGMVDPAVFDACGYDSERYHGFAFGIGVERIAMLRYGIPDIRLFFENDLRFLRQFYS